MSCCLTAVRMFNGSLNQSLIEVVEATLES